MGATKVLLHMPAIPPDTKLFRIFLYLFWLGSFIDTAYFLKVGLNYNITFLIYYFPKLPTFIL